MAHTKQLVHEKKGCSLLWALGSSPVSTRIKSASCYWDEPAPSLPPCAGGTPWLCPSPSWVPAANSAAFQPLSQVPEAPTALCYSLSQEGLLLFLSDPNKPSFSSHANSTVIAPILIMLHNKCHQVAASMLL